MATRYERVVVELQDEFTTKMARIAAETAAADKAMADFGGTAGKTGRELESGRKALDDNGRAIQQHGQKVRAASDDLNKYTGRLNLLLTAVTTIGPGLIPLTAGLIPAVTGLAAGFGAAAGAAGVAMLAFHGVGDAIKAVDAYQITPTTANLKKMRDALDGLGPAGADFAKFISGLEPELHALQDTAREGMFPGIEAGIKELMPLLPEVQRIIGGISTELGTLAEKAGHGLANDASFQQFFHYIETDAAPTMDAFAKATGHVASGLASLTVAFAPVNRDFAAGMEHAAASFDTWAAGLSKTQGFRDFLAYIEHEGPQVVHLMEALGEAALGIIHAAQPVGSVVVPALTALANIIGAIGKSPLGPMIYTAVAAMLVLSRTSSVAAAAIDKLAASWLGVGAAARTAAVAQETAVAASLGGAAGAARTAKITGVSSLLAASPLTANAGSKVAAGISAAGIAALVAYLAGNAVGGTINYAGSHLDPSAKNLGTKDNVSAVQNSLENGWGSGELKKHLDPAAWLGFNPAGWGNKKPVQNADLALAQMVNSGQTDKAAAIFKKFGVSVDEAAKKFPNYTQALDVATGVTRNAYGAVTITTTAIKGQVQALHEQHTAMLGNYDAITQFGSAMQSLAKQAASGTKGFNQFTAAGVANRQAVSGAVAAWNAQPDSIKNNIKSFEAARQKINEFAAQMGATKGQIAQLDRAMDKPKLLTIDGNAAVKTLLQVQSLLNQLHDRNIHVNVTKSTNAAIGEAAANNKHASGGYISGPGGPRDDAIPAWLSNGEFVVNADATAQHRDLLEQINARRFASGGYVGGYDINSISYAHPSSTSKASASKAKATSKGAKKAKKPTRADVNAAIAAAQLRHLVLDLTGLGGNEFKELRKGLRDLVGKDLKLAGDGLKDLNKASKLLGKSYNAEKQARDDVVNKRDTLSSSVAGLFSGSLWDGGGNPFTGGFAKGSIQGALAAEQQRQGQITDYGALIKQVQDKGIHGEALNELIANGGIDALRSAAAADASTDQQFASLYASNSQGIQTLSTSVGRSEYGAQIDRLDKKVQEVNHNLKIVAQAIKDKTKVDDQSRMKAAQHAGETTAAGVNGAAKKGAHHNPRRGH